ncbi:MAG: hypothetical protein HRT53_17865 [Colwellia sp.]|nr:hypothetical protein [Colwellia sp.]
MLRPSYLTSSLLLTCLLLSVPITATVHEKTAEQLEHDKWLKLRFSEQHKKLIPIVAVADIFFACDKAKNSGTANYKVIELVENMDRNLLADKLSTCLAGESMQSDIALNYGLYGCFYEQLDHLSKGKKLEKMRVVTVSISSLSREDRQKSFSRCVTDQSISYLK